MSVNAAQEYQTRIVRATASSTLTAVGATTIFMTIPQWPAFATLQRLLISANNNFSSITATIYTDAASWRAASTANKPKFVQFSQADTNNAVNSITINGNGAYLEDAYRTGFLYLSITSGSAFTAGTVFTVTAEGHAQLPAQRRDNDNMLGLATRTYRALYMPAAAATATDVTANALLNGTPYGIGNVFGVDTNNYSANWTALAATGDFLYVGADQPITKLLALIPLANLQPAAAVLTAQVWNGTTWAAATVYDNTSDGQATASSFSYSGVIAIPAPAAWVPLKLTVDPLTTLETSIATGGQPAMNFLYNPKKYWIRFSLSAVSPTLKMIALQPLA